MISKVMIKFQFQFPLQFYRTVEKVETYDANVQNRHLFNLPILVTVLFDFL